MGGKANTAAGPSLQQLNNCLSPGKIYTTAQKSTFSKFPAIGNPSPRSKNFGKDGLQDQVAAVAVQFNHIFTSVGIRGLHEHGKHFVKHNTVAIGNGTVIQLMTLEGRMRSVRRKQAVQNSSRLRAADTDNTNTAGAGGSGYGGYGITYCRTSGHPGAPYLCGNRTCSSCRVCRSGSF